MYIDQFYEIEMSDKVYFICPHESLTTELFKTDIIARKSNPSQLKLQNLQMTEAQMQNWLIELLLKGIDISKVKMQFVNGVFSNPNKPQTPDQIRLLNDFDNAKAYLLNEKKAFLANVDNKTQGEADYNLLIELRIKLLKFRRTFELEKERVNIELWRKDRYLINWMISENLHHEPIFQADLMKILTYIRMDLYLNQDNIRLLHQNGLLDAFIISLLMKNTIPNGLLQDSMLEVFSKVEHPLDFFKSLVTHPDVKILARIISSTQSNNIEILVNNLTTLNSQELQNLASKFNGSGFWGINKYLNILLNKLSVQLNDPGLMISIFDKIMSDENSVNKENLLKFCFEQHHEHLIFYQYMIEKIGVDKTFLLVKEKVFIKFLESLVIPHFDRIDNIENFLLFLHLLEIASPEVQKSFIDNQEKLLECVNSQNFLGLSNFNTRYFFIIMQNQSQFVDFLINSEHLEDIISILEVIQKNNDDEFQNQCHLLMKCPDISVLKQALEQSNFLKELVNTEYELIFSHANLDLVVKLIDRLFLGHTEPMRIRMNQCLEILKLSNISELLTCLEQVPDFAKYMERILDQLTNLDDEYKQKLRFLIENKLSVPFMNAVVEEGLPDWRHPRDLLTMLGEITALENPQRALFFINLNKRLNLETQKKFEIFFQNTDSKTLSKILKMTLGSLQFSYPYELLSCLEMLQEFPELLNEEIYNKTLFQFYKLAQNKNLDLRNIFNKMMNLPNGMELCGILVQQLEQRSLEIGRGNTINNIFSSSNLSEISRFILYFPTEPIADYLFILELEHTCLEKLNDVFSSLNQDERNNLLLSLVEIESYGMTSIFFDSFINANNPLVFHQFFKFLMSQCLPFERSPKFIQSFEQLNHLIQNSNIDDHYQMFLELNRLNVKLSIDDIELLLGLKHPAVVLQKMQTNFSHISEFNSYTVLIVKMFDRFPDMKQDYCIPQFVELYNLFQATELDFPELFSKIWHQPRGLALCQRLFDGYDNHVLSKQNLYDFLTSNRLEETLQILHHNPKLFALPRIFIYQNEHLSWLAHFIDGLSKKEQSKLESIFLKFASFNATQVNQLMIKLMSIAKPYSFLLTLDFALSKSPNGLLEQYLSELMLVVERLHELDEISIYEAFSSLSDLGQTRNLLQLVRDGLELDASSFLAIAYCQDNKSLIEILFILQNAGLLNGETGSNNLTLLSGETNLDRCLKNIRTLKDEGNLNQESLINAIYQTNLSEPILEKYILVDDAYNHVHVFMPLVSGEEIGMDNTCKTTESLREFFGFKTKKKSIQDVIQDYIRALESDLSIIRPGTELAQQKQVRLAQLTQYSEATSEIMKLSAVRDFSTKVFPEYPEGIKHLFKNPQSNLASMQLSPVEADAFLRTINPIFSLRNLESDSFSPALLNTLIQTNLPVVSMRATFMHRVLEEVETIQDLTYEQLQDILHQKTFECFGETVDYRSVSIESICETLGVEVDQFHSEITSFIEGLLGFAASSLFDSQLESPFLQQNQNHAIFSILIQFYLAECNIYAQQHDIGSDNFGLRLQEHALQKDFMDCLKGIQGDIELSIAQFINQHASEFGLSRALESTEIAEIRKNFARHYFLVKESPHFDEFMVMNFEKKGIFHSHQASICVDYLDFIRESIPELQINHVLQEVLQKTRQLPVKLDHKNEWVDPGRNIAHLSVTEQCERVKSGYPLGFLMAKLNQYQQRNVINELGEQIFDILRHPPEYTCLKPLLSKLALNYVVDLAIACDKLDVMDLPLSLEKIKLRDIVRDMSIKYPEETQLIRAILARDNQKIDILFEQFPRMSKSFIDAVFAHPEILEVINRVMVDREAPILKKPEDMALQTMNQTVIFREQLKRGVGPEAENTPILGKRG